MLRNCWAAPLRSIRLPGVSVGASNQSCSIKCVLKHTFLKSSSFFHVHVFLFSHDTVRKWRKRHLVQKWPPMSNNIDIGFGLFIPSEMQNSTKLFTKKSDICSSSAFVMFTCVPLKMCDFVGDAKSPLADSWIWINWISLSVHFRSVWYWFGSNC